MNVNLGFERKLQRIIFLSLKKIIIKVKKTTAKVLKIANWLLKKKVIDFKNKKTK